MIDLRSGLTAEAGRVSPAASLAGVLDRVRRRHRRRRTGQVIACATIACVLLLGAVALSSTAQVRPAARFLPITHVAAIVLDPLPGQRPGESPGQSPGQSVTSLERRDPTAVDGSWTVTVRAPDGSIAFHSAIVSFPVPKPLLAERVVIDAPQGEAGQGGAGVGGAVEGVAADGQVVWPIADGYARVRGDLPRHDLVAIAEATTVQAGVPVVGRLPGLSVGPSRPYRPPSIHERRWYDVELAGPQIGHVYTGVQVSGGFEDQVLAQHGRTGYMVQGHPAVVSSVEGGSATLAWEPEPGVIAYLGYSGETPTADIVRQLIAIADRTRPIDAAQWQATNPQIDEQHNGPIDM